MIASKMAAMKGLTLRLKYSLLNSNQLLDVQCLYMNTSIHVHVCTDMTCHSIDINFVVESKLSIQIIFRYDLTILFRFDI